MVGLRNGHFDPYISTPGVKNGINNVNKTKMTPIFPLQAWFGTFMELDILVGVNN